MDDLIERKAAIDAVVAWTVEDRPDIEMPTDLIGRINALPSAQKYANEYRKQGEWEMFELITSTWYGKQCYFDEENDMVYSRISGKTMTVHDAILEFLRRIGDDGSY